MIQHTNSHTAGGYSLTRDCESRRSDCGTAAMMSTTPFLRNSDHRTSVNSMPGTLRQPKLPGTERFRFTRSSEDLCRSTSQAQPLPFLPNAGRRSVNNSRFDVDGSLSSRFSAVAQHRRKPIIPISRQTSRVLNNTNAELSVDTIDFIRTETDNLNEICQNYLHSGATSNVVVSKCPQSASSGVDMHEDLGYEDTWRPSFSTFLGSARTQRNEPNPVTGASPLNAMSEKSLSVDRDWMRLRMRTGSSGSPSPTLSVCSSDSDVWVLRQDAQPK